MPEDEQRDSDASTPAPMIPDHFRRRPPVRDALATDTSAAQDDTVEKCLPLMAGMAGEARDGRANEHGVPRLDRQRHAKFLHSNLGALPGRLRARRCQPPVVPVLVPQRPGPAGRGRVRLPRRPGRHPAASMQNPAGGFGGGGGQTSHLATTYALVLSLAIVGGPACYDAVDRRALWRWLCTLKQPDGGFRMSVGGEEDIRCVATDPNPSSLPASLPAPLYMPVLLSLPLQTCPFCSNRSPNMPVLFSLLLPPQTCPFCSPFPPPNMPVLP